MPLYQYESILLILKHSPVAYVKVLGKEAFDLTLGEVNCHSCSVDNEEANDVESRLLHNVPTA
jgi:hypothetical protein